MSRSEIERSRGLQRGFLVIANSVAAVAAICTVCVGVWSLTSESFLLPLVPDTLLISSAYIQVVTGLLGLANCTFGCYAAFKEVKALLVAHCALSSLILSFFAVAAAVALIFRGQVEGSMKAQLVREIRRYDPHLPENPITKAWDLTQSRLECCGLVTPRAILPWQSWSDNEVLNPGGGEREQALPASCCPASPHLCTGKLAWPGDCFTSGLDFLSSHSLTLAATACVPVATLLVVLFGTILLLKALC